MDVDAVLAAVAGGVRAELEKRPDDWGPDHDGAEAWAVQAVRERLEAVNGRMAVGILRRLELPQRELGSLRTVFVLEAWQDGDEEGAAWALTREPVKTSEADRAPELASVATARDAWSWPFGRDEGASLCRASLALLEEADRLAAGADWGRDEAAKAIGAVDGRGVWEPRGGLKVPRAVRVLCGAAAARWKADRERAKVTRPAVVRLFAAEVVLPLTRGTLDLLDDKVRAAGGKVLGSVSVPHLEGDAAKALINRGLAGFGHVVGHRLVDAVVRRAWMAHEAGHALPNRVVWEGGWSGMAAEVMGKQRDTGQLRAIVEVGCGLRFKGDGFEATGLWSKTERRGGPGKPGEVALVVNDPLLPGFALSMKRADATGRMSLREARRLVPLLAHEPPVGAVRPNEAGAVWGLSRRFVLCLVDESEQLAKGGGVRLLRNDWERLAKDAGLDPRLLERVLRSWELGESESAPELLRRNGDLWTLAEPHSAELEFIVANGRRRLEGRANGRAGVAARNRQRRKRVNDG